MGVMVRDSTTPSQWMAGSVCTLLRRVALLEKAVEACGIDMVVENQHRTAKVVPPVKSVDVPYMEPSGHEVYQDAKRQHRARLSTASTEAPDHDLETSDIEQVATVPAPQFVQIHRQLEQHVHASMHTIDTVVLNQDQTTGMDHGIETQGIEQLAEIPDMVCDPETSDIERFERLPMSHFELFRHHVAQQVQSPIFHNVAEEREGEEVHASKSHHGQVQQCSVDQMVRHFEQIHHRAAQRSISHRPALRHVEQDSHQLRPSKRVSFAKTLKSTHVVVRSEEETAQLWVEKQFPCISCDDCGQKIRLENYHLFRLSGGDTASCDACKRCDNLERHESLPAYILELLEVEADRYGEKLKAALM